MVYYDFASLELTIHTTTPLHSVEESNGFQTGFYMMGEDTVEAQQDRDGWEHLAVDREW